MRALVFSLNDPDHQPHDRLLLVGAQLAAESAGHAHQHLADHQDVHGRRILLHLMVVLNDTGGHPEHALHGGAPIERVALAHELQVSLGHEHFHQVGVFAQVFEAESALGAVGHFAFRVGAVAAEGPLEPAEEAPRVGRDVGVLDDNLEEV